MVDARDHNSLSPVRTALVFGLVAATVLSVVVAWWGFRAYQSHRDDALRALFLDTASQSAVNLTTLRWESADAAAQLILDGSVDPFHGEFDSDRSEFVDWARTTQTTADGVVTDAGIESFDDGTAVVLVSVDVVTSTGGAAAEPVRQPRMRISVERVGDGAKMSDVEYVE